VGQGRVRTRIAMRLGVDQSALSRSEKARIGRIFKAVVASLRAGLAGGGVIGGQERGWGAAPHPQSGSQVPEVRPASLPQAG
jgi:hypothetical protein